MQTQHPPDAANTAPVDTDATATNGHGRRMCIMLVRHGQTTFNVEKRLPGQLAGIPLTEEGKRQAVRAAVALSGLPLSRIVSSPLERARDTARLIARGWGLDVTTDDRLKDTDVGHWSGKTIEEVSKSDPAWKEFVKHSSQPPPGVESLADVMRRSVAAVEDIRHDPGAGEYVLVVAHADVVKLIIAHYTGIDVDRAHLLAVDNASISALAFEGTHQPALLALNWTASPGWLFALPRAEANQSTAGQEHASPNGGAQPIPTEQHSSE